VVAALAAGAPLERGAGRCGGGAFACFCGEEQEQMSGRKKNCAV